VLSEERALAAMFNESDIKITFATNLLRNSMFFALFCIRNKLSRKFDYFQHYTNTNIMSIITLLSQEKARLIS
jgi:hypothetical protein